MSFYARLVLVYAAAVAAQVVIVPWAYGLELARRHNEPHWDWDTVPSLTDAPAYRELKRAA